MTGGEESTPAVVKSGEGDAATGASAPSPAPWLTAGDMAMNDLQRELPPEMEALSPKKQVAALVGLHTRLLKAQERTHPFHVPASTVPGALKTMVEVLSTKTNPDNPQFMAAVITPPEVTDTGPGF